MKRGLSRLAGRLFRKGQTGQTIVILAFGFIVLLGFVGIVTDVSLMFVRYSTLRRAIDAAAVSAAGQMRRATPTDIEIARANAQGGTTPEKEQRAIGYAYARNITSVNLAARQFIELYGLIPTTVLVDTCATTPADAQLECDASKTPRKLVRVTAQIQSPTVFLRLLGWGTVTLEATAISETAVLDVVMIFDVSESMLNQTTYDDWDKVPQADGTTKDESMRYYPPRITYPASGDAAVTSYAGHPTSFTSYYDAWDYFLNHSENELKTYSDPVAVAAGQPGGIFQAIPFYVTGDGSGQTVQTALANDPRQPRSDCRVRAFPGAGSFGIMATGADPFKPENDVQVELTKFMNLRGYGGTYPGNFDGFVPAYNYFGCCNDPDGNWEFTDLVCQPMAQVRTATEGFLDRIDFSRGDRVAFVTFDRFAYLIDPDGAGPQPAMMDSQIKALEMLHKDVGVRADPSYYADTDSNGFWDSFVLGGAAWSPTNTDPNIKLIKYGSGNVAPITQGFNGTPIGILNDYPVYNNCIYQNATLRYPLSLYSSPTLGTAPTYADGNSQLTYATHPPYYKQRWPTPLSSAFNLPPVMHPPLPTAPWLGQVPSGQVDIMQYYSYELRSACRGSNVGAALRTANNALLDPKTSRTNGAVWVMVMLGDGAAAGSDPVRRNGANLNVPQIYNGTVKTDLTLDVPPVAGDYGVYGVCPYGSYADHGNAPLLDGNWSRLFPYCSDLAPESRHFCYDPNTVDADKNQYIDIAATTECAEQYDVDDFARDWADAIGIANSFPGKLTPQQLDERKNFQFPTIFTIGFGLDFQQGDHSSTAVTQQANIEDYLGEELLRYIADVGDNNHIDTDYEQDWRDGSANKIDKVLASDDDWGPRGPCEGPLKNGYTDPSQVPINNLNDLVNPLPPKQNCGNYFNAPDAAELKVVFDTIASRMFTRLTR
ncbi:MAG: pilus assembly protein TadG-related protein [Chloroflexota bacterium]